MSTVGHVEVALEVSSWIEGRGVRHTNWSVRVNDAWIPIGELRDVVRTMTDPDLSFDDEVDERRVLPPGCQYRITYHPRLAVGARVQRRVSVPLVQPSHHKAAPETIEGAFQRFMAAGFGQKLPLKTTFTDFRVTVRGRFVTEETWQRHQQQRPDDTARTNREHARSTISSDAVTRAEIEAFARRLDRVG